MFIERPKDYIVKIHYKEEFSGVLFRANKDTKYAYIITAKHGFFKDEEERKNYASDCLSLDDNLLEITQEKDKNNDLRILKNKVYFYSDIDLALMVVDLQTEFIDRFPDLKIMDTSVDNVIPGAKYYAWGYPQYSQGNYGLQEVQPIVLRKNQSNSQFAEIEEFIDENPIAYNPLERGEVIEKIKGFSGGGIFHNEIGSPLQLRAIQTDAYFDKGIMGGISLDTILDDLNQFIRNTIGSELPLIESSASIFIDNEKLHYSDFQDFNFFKEKIEANVAFEKFLERHSELNSTAQSGKEDIPKIAAKARLEGEKIVEHMNSLSYVFAKLAVLSQENNQRNATTKYFKQAIKWNPAHKQAFLTERAIRNKDIKKIEEQEKHAQTSSQKIDVYDAEHEALLKRFESGENNTPEQIQVLAKLIKEICIAITSQENLEEDEKLRLAQKSEDYQLELESLYKNEAMLRSHYQYFNIGNFYGGLAGFKIDAIDKKAFFHYYVAEMLLEHAPDTQGNRNLKKYIRVGIEGLANSDLSLGAQEEARSKAKDEAMRIIRSEEDPDTKELLKGISHELSGLLNSSYSKSLSLTDIRKNLVLLEDSLHRQVGENRMLNSLVDESNAIFLQLNDLAAELNVQVQNAFQEYQLQLDTEVKEELTQLVINEMKASDRTLAFDVLENIAKRVEELEICTVSDLGKSTEQSRKKLTTFFEELTSGLETSNSQLDGLNLYMTGELSKKLAQMQAFNETAVQVVNDFNSSIKSEMAELAESLDEKRQSILTAIEQASVADETKKLLTSNLDSISSMFMDKSFLTPMLDEFVKKIPIDNSVDSESFSHLKQDIASVIEHKFDEKTLLITKSIHSMSEVRKPTRSRRINLLVINGVMGISVLIILAILVYVFLFVGSDLGMS